MNTTYHTYILDYYLLTFPDTFKFEAYARDTYYGIIFIDSQGNKYDVAHTLMGNRICVNRINGSVDNDIPFKKETFWFLPAEIKTEELQEGQIPTATIDNMKEKIATNTQSKTFDIKDFFGKLQVLDKGHIELFDGMVSDPKLKIVNAARVSFNKEISELTEKDIKLINFLYKHEHFSTFRHSYFSFRVKAPLLVFRQWWKYQIGCDWIENENIGTIQIPETNWNEMCLEENSLVYIVEADGQTREIKIVELYYKYQQDRNILNELKVISLDETTQQFILGTIQNVIGRGNQNVFQIKLEDGKSVVCTTSHEILTKNGWLAVWDCLNPQIKDESNDVEFSDNVFFMVSDKNEEPKYSKVISIEFLGRKPCYDLEIAGMNKNFVCDGIVVHNSGRYVEFQPEFYVPQEIRIQSQNNKQGSSGKLLNLTNGEDPVAFFEQSCQTMYHNYEYMVKSGAAKEQARGLLPQTIYTECVWTASLQCILYVLHQRLKPDAQYEIRQYALALAQLILPILKPLDIGINV